MSTPKIIYTEPQDADLIQIESMSGDFTVLKLSELDDLSEIVERERPAAVIIAERKGRSNLQSILEALRQHSVGKQVAIVYIIETENDPRLLSEPLPSGVDLFLKRPDDPSGLNDKLKEYLGKGESCSSDDAEEKDSQSKTLPYKTQKQGTLLGAQTVSFSPSMTHECDPSFEKKAPCDLSKNQPTATDSGPPAESGEEALSDSGPSAESEEEALSNGGSLSVTDSGPSAESEEEALSDEGSLSATDLGPPAQSGEEALSNEGISDPPISASPKGELCNKQISPEHEGARTSTSPLFKVCTTQSASDNSMKSKQVEQKYAQVCEGDYFTLLEISQEATVEEIARAYATLSQDYDPDTLSSDLKVKYKMQLEEIREVLSEARKVLSDETLRNAYREAMND